MQELFYLLLGVLGVVVGIGSIALPTYLIVKIIKNVGKKDKTGKENIIVDGEKKEKVKERSADKSFAIIFGSAFVFIVAIVMLGLGTGGEIDNSSKMVKKIKSALNVNSEEAIAMENIFKSIGIDEIGSIEADEILDEYGGAGSKGYRVKTSFSNNVILYVSSDNKIICISWADKDFYRDGNVLLNFGDYLVTWDERNEYNIDAQKRIKALLKAPSTAKFPSINNWNFRKDNGKVTVQSYVDSENSFGAKLRSYFQVKYDENKNAISLIIDGIEYYK